jgi:3-methyladenine DNA glycosylase AlkD
MARFGIRGANVLGGTSMPELRAMARRLRPDHRLAEELWNSGVHEARILASLVDDPALVTERQMERWAGDLDSWDLVDQCCGNLFDRTPFAWRKAVEWSEREEEYVKRAAFSLMASLAVHDRGAEDGPFNVFLAIIEREAGDGRNFVKKAVNWALREIGKRNEPLRRAAIETARRILEARGGRNFVASDAVRELTSEAVRARVRRRPRPRP